MFLYNKMDSYYYSRPISYRSYYPRINKEEILTINDQESDQVLELLRNNKL